MEVEQWAPKQRGLLWMRRTQAPPPPLRLLDWTVDGTPLRDRLACPDGTLCREVTFLTEGSDGDARAVESLRALLLENVSGFDPWVQFTDGRAGILFCPQCGDLDCGTVSADVRYTGDVVEWRDIGYQDGFADGVAADSELAPFTLRFDRAQYEGLLRSLLTQWSAGGRTS